LGGDRVDGVGDRQIAVGQTALPKGGDAGVVRPLAVASVAAGQ
jgi:hypothetical protein